MTLSADAGRVVGTRTKVVLCLFRSGRKKTAISAKFVTTINFVGVFVVLQYFIKSVLDVCVGSPAEENN